MSGTPSSDAPVISPDEPYNPDATPADAPAPEAADAPAGEVAHTTDDAGNAIDVHYDEAGEVVLIEADTDGDGQIDTAAAPTADGGAVIASDLDSDGVVDEEPADHRQRWGERMRLSQPLDRRDGGCRAGRVLIGIDPAREA